jgi:HlyD family secretion protein
VQAGETVFTLTLSSPVWVRTYVNEQDLGTVEPGMKVNVTTDAGREYAGRIGFVSPTAEFTPKTVETRELRTDLVYRVRVVVEDPDGGLRQGMPVTVAVQLPGPRRRTFTERLFDALWLDRLGFHSGRR